MKKTEIRTEGIPSGKSEIKKMYPDAPKRDLTNYLMVKRFFDFFFALALLVVLSPFLLLVALLIKIESPRGPIIYRSKRVGKDFQVFNFYKFRSMRPDADKMMAEMKALSQYRPAMQPIVSADSLSQELHTGLDSSLALFSDEGWVSERTFLVGEEVETEHNFVKIQNDPRITKVGSFIRKTSVDELPQLWNVVVGDMSLVGNRPLPLYEAEKLTTDEFIQRFMAPAGITGLWQVTERGKKDVTAQSRKMLDVEYAKRCSFWLDFYILVKTPFAAFQEEAV